MSIGMTYNRAKTHAGYAYSDQEGDMEELDKKVKRVGAIPWNETSNIPIHMLKYVLLCSNMSMEDIQGFVNEDAGALMYTAYPYDTYLFFHDEEGIKSAIRNWTKGKLSN